MSSKPLRLTMPFTAAVIDEVRAAFGVDEINTQVRNGMAGLPHFWSRENGIEIGMRGTEGRGITGAQMVLQLPANTKRAK